MRSTAKLLAALFLALSVVLSGVGASAQPAPGGGAPAASGSAAAPAGDAGEAEKKEKAKQLFLKGLELVQNEEWDAALAEFLASREVYPTRVALKNAGICLRQLKRYSEALVMYRELIAKFAATTPPEELKSIQEAMTQLQGFVGEIAVEADQTDASVIVDGQTRGSTPLSEAVTVNAGTHTVRVFKEGFSPHEEQVLVAGGQKKQVKAKLVALAKSGRLTVTEADGKKLRVIVDGADVGETPWTGTLSVGTHTVFLHGENDMGTPPSAATVFDGRQSTLTLRAAKLDAGIRVEPTPSNARIDIDGVQITNGVWEGQLISGSHKIEVTAPGFLAYRKDVALKSGQREVLRVALERDLSDPMWRSSFFRPHLYAELVGGVMWAPTLSGASDAACARGECSERSRPFGFMVGGRGGYQLTSGLGIEVFGGYLKMDEKMTRALVAAGENRKKYIAHDYDDQTSFGGPMGALSVSYQFFDKTPVVVRLWAGAARIKASFVNGGTYTGAVPRASNPVRVEVATVSQHIEVLEESPRLWMPFIAPEARVGYRFGKRFAMDVGVALFLFFPPQTLRKGRTSLSNGEGERIESFLDPAGNYIDGEQVRAGLLTLPKENAFGTFYAVVPTLGGRFDF